MKKLQHTTPKDLTFQLLETITNNFSEEHKVGIGGYGVVYKGVLPNGQEIAVKKLHQTLGLDDKQFKKEFDNLMRIQQHQNIIHLVGYCYEIRHKHFMLDDGKIIFVRMEERALCFEYLEHGSLDRHLSDESSGLGWRTRYKIMKGICKGLNYLHTGISNPVYHLDLKPSNILLDKDMVPKIADFGLSRLLMTNSHITTGNFCGTIAYVPPEYIQRRHISNKFDIFSLGVIFIEVVSGPMGYSTYVDMVPEQFIELVQNSWRKRIGITSDFTEEYCQQVKRCIEIALKCLEVDKNKRPAIGEVISMLIETETAGQREDEDNVSELAKFGPWGGKGGRAQDMEVAPARLDSITIRSGNVIHSIEFSYTDHDGEYHNSGRWGSHGRVSDTFHLGPSEFVTGISGTIDPPNTALGVIEVISSLTFVTSAHSYGPFGQVRGTPFNIPMQSNDCIVGFFGRSGDFLDAIGVYTKRDPGIFQQEEAAVARIGPWGGDGGALHDIAIKPHHLESVTIFSGTIIDSLEFTYSDQDGQQHTAGSWGGSGGSEHKIHLDPSEFIMKVSGTFSPWQGLPNVVTSLTLVSSTGRRYGPYGRERGPAFHVPARSNGRIVGFFAHGKHYIEAIGAYVSTL